MILPVTRRRKASAVRSSLRIVQLVETLETGGLERIAVDLALAQKNAGHQPVIYCMFHAGVLGDEAKAAGIPVIEFNKKPGFSLKLVSAMAQQLRRDAPDVLHTHNPGVHHYGAIAAWMAGIRAIVNTRHGPVTSFGHAYQERYFRAVLPLTDRVVFVCEDSRRYLEGHGLSLEKSFVIPNGISLERFLENPASPGSARPRIRFGTVGRMVPVKAHSVLIEAFSQIAARLPEAELRIVGGGPLAGELDEQVRRLGLDAKVHVEPQTRDIASVLRNLDVFVLSSVNEGLPVVILEAMAAGLPIVASRVGGIPEVAPEEIVSILCAPGCPDELAAGMYRAATGLDLGSMGRAAREIAQSRFGLGTMWHSYESVYFESLTRK